MTIPRPSARLAFLLALLVSSPILASEETSSPEEIPLRLPETVVPVVTTLDLHLEPEDDDFRGRTEIEVEVKEPTARIWLNARNLTIGSATVTQDAEDLEAIVETRGQDFLLLTLPRALAAGPARIAIDYEAPVERVDTVGVFGEEQDGESYLFTQFEAIDARRAFPGFDEPGFKHPWRLTLHVPEADRAFSNTPVAAESVTDGVRTVRFEETPPLPSYLVAFAVGPFEVVDLGRAGARDTPIRLVVPKGDGADTGYAGSTVAEILDWMEGYLGIPYPYAKLDQLAIPQTVGFGAMEHPGLITYATSIMVIPEEEMSLERKIRWDSVYAHELAHQWFGDLVTMAWWNDIWLNEGFANWIEGKTMTALRPAWGAALDRVEGRDRAMSLDALVSARKVRQPITGNDDIENAFDGITYAKGAALLSMFESWLGEARFQGAIRHYLTVRSHDTATSDDLLDALATTGEEAVSAAFAGFLDEPGVPLVRVSLSCPEDGAPELALRQQRFLPVGSTGNVDESWLLPLCVRYPIGADETRTHCGLLRGTAGNLSLPGAESCPAWVLANAGETGYYRTAYEGDLLGGLLADDGRQLDEPELLGVLGDTVALAEAGRAPLDTVLAATLPFADHPRHQVAELLIALLAKLDDHLVPSSLLPAYASLVRDTFGARASELGFTPSPSDSADDEILRPDLIGLVGDEGRDPMIEATASRRARAWLADRSAVAPELVSTVLALAARRGDATLFDRYLDEARRTEDASDRRQLLSALGHFEDPELRARAFDLFFDDGFHVRETRRVLWGARSTPAGRAAVWRFVRENWDRIVERLPQQSRGSLPRYVGDFCSREKARELDAFFTPRIEGLEGAPRNLARTLESIELCAAWVNEELPALRRYLTAW